MDINQKNEILKKWSSIVFKALKDENFKKKLLSNPSKVLNEEGLHLPEGINCCILENSKNKMYFILPEKNADSLSNQYLKKVAAASPAYSNVSKKINFNLVTQENMYGFKTK